MTTHQARVRAGGDVFLDARNDGGGDGRALVVRWEHEADPTDDTVTLGLWRGATCVGTFRLTRDEVPSLLATLTAGLAATTR